MVKIFLFLTPGMQYQKLFRFLFLFLKAFNFILLLYYSLNKPNVLIRYINVKNLPYEMNVS